MPSSLDNNWQPLDIGAGGWLTGIDIAPDDTMVVRTDTYGAYIWNGTEWQQLVTSTSMPAATVAAGTPQGVYEIQIAPSDTNILYMEYSGNVYRSDNKGETWTQTAFSTVTESANDLYRMDGQKMAIDPSDPNVVYVGTPQNGLFVTTDGGASWQNVGAIPVSTKDSNGIYQGITGITFDPTSGTTGGKTNTIYASSAGNGVFESTNGGVSWSALAGGPKDVETATVSSNGVYYAVGDNNTQVWRYANGAWTELLSDTTNGFHTVTVDPFNPNHIVVATMGGSLNQSLDGGTTWSGQNWNTQFSATDVPWLATAGQYMSIGGMEFDQLVPNKIWASDGVGVWDTTVPTKLLAGTPIVWTSQSAGIEQLVANEIIVPPGGNPVVASWDRAFFEVNNPDVAPSSVGISGFAAGWSLDYASSDPKFLVGIADWWGVEKSGYSTDGGQTWNLFPTMPSFAGKAIGGTIAASSPADIVWAPADGYAPVYTKDGGVTWNNVVLPGVTDWSQFDFAYYLDKQTVTADRVLPDTFYLYYNGVYKSTDGGATWTEVYNKAISAFSGFNSKIEAVPGEAGNLFFTGGPQGVATHPAGEQFYQSNDGGASWTAVPNVLEVKTFGFGAPAAPGGYPSVYIVGWVNQVYGIWQSNDDAKSWTQIGDYPDGSLDNIKTISGDPNAYGQVYIGFQGSGYAYLPAASNTTPTITIAYSPDTGQVGDGFTNATVLTLSGIAGAGSTIKVYDGSVLLGNATADASGAWNFSTLKLASGAHAFTAAATDLAGNTGTPSSVLTVTVDTIAPVAPTITSFAPDTGTVGDGVTAATVLTLSGTAEASSLVKIYDGSTLLGSVIANANGGAWSFATPKLANGSHALTATATDLAGNTGAASSAVTVTVASTTGAVPSGTPGPIVTENLFLDTGPSSTDNATSNDTLTGKAEPNATVTLTEGTQTLGTVKADAAGTWTFAPVGLSNGMNLIVASETNAAGVVGKASINFRFDTTPPTVQSEGPSSADLIGGRGVLHTGSTVVFTLGLSENSMVAGGIPWLSLSNGGTATYDAQRSTPTVLVFDYTVAPGQSAPSLAVTSVNLNGASVTDVAGNEVNFAGALKSFTGIVVNAPASAVLPAPDTPPAAPTITSFSPDTGTVGDGVTNATVLMLTGTAEASSTVKIYDGSTLLGTATADANGAWNFAATGRANGSHDFTATATDLAGNTGTASAALTVTVDTIAPAAPTVMSFLPDSGTVGDGVTNATVLTLTGTAEASSTVKIYDGSTLLGKTTTDSNGAWNLATANLANGSHAFTATATDSAGNISTASSALTVMVDTIAPGAPTVTTHSLGPASVATLNGTAEANSLLNIYDRSTLVGTVTANSSGAWSFVSSSLSLGSHVFTATATDLAGNVSTASSPWMMAIAATPALGPVTVASVVTEKLLYDTGVSSTDLATSNDWLTGTADPNSVVTLMEGSKTLGTVETDSMGQWTFQPIGLSNGFNNIIVSDTNAGGLTAKAALNFRLDTSAPSVQSEGPSGLGLIGGHGVLHAGDTVVFTVGLTKNSIIVGGTPTLKLSDGGIATYDAQHSTPTALLFDYTVASGEYASSLSVVGLNLNGAIATDVAGNAVNFAGAIKTFSGLVVDATTPVAAADHSHLATGGTLMTAASAGVLANDQDVNPFDTLSVSAVNGQSANVGHSVNGEFGTLTLNADGSYVYNNTNVAAVTALGGAAEDVFTYTANNGHGGVANSTLSIAVTSPGETYVSGPSGSTITGGSGSYVLDGSAGNVTAIAGAGTQFLLGGSGDTLTAGSGSDTFIFAANSGKNTVNSFDTTHDVIELPKAEFSSVATVLADAHQVGANTVITIDAADTITLSHILLQNLHASNFFLV